MFSKYNDKINKLIPLLIDKEVYYEILKRKKLLTITEKIFEYVGDIVSVSLGLLINDFAFSIGTTLFLRGLSMAFKKYQSKQEEVLEDLKFNGKDKLKKVESGVDIFEKLSKDFKLNISEGKISKEGA
ncbi:hypothetical protein SAMN02745195_02367 [Thermoanaerobacter uzonensis DSM 18761]|uniref:Uncharacterized protein n=1 Tax=Thermoanaerobacter uzonensis DSM 18761 TaxID=1123369 RepID=A0A1M5APZ5_9THEO|nr:hypothetical protein [Thermoanaerobacter uzonensis]SHF32323.1 hypothetical protein SAMN02745195_02367 [Thermoanaerobacter uzonensis DSM 18761]